MNYLKIQQDILKATLNTKISLKQGVYVCPYFEMEDAIFVCPEALFGMKIPKNLFYLDKEKVFEAPPWDVGGKMMISNSVNTFDAEDTRTVIDYIHNKKKMKLHIFDVESGERVYVDERFMKYFDDCTEFTGSTSKSPIYVWKNGVVVGMIMPVIKTEGED